MTPPADVPRGASEPPPAVGKHAAAPAAVVAAGDMPGPGASIVALIDALDTLSMRATARVRSTSSTTTSCRGCGPSAPRCLSSSAGRRAPASRPS
jgi:hypothetical protein